MRVKMSFLCEHCAAEFEKPKDAMEHEASHYGLTMAEFSYWHLLSQAASDAGKRVDTCKNQKTEEIFHQAVIKLCDFETKHNLTEARRPSDWMC